jgi:excisionase family DNA binding protein
MSPKSTKQIAAEVGITQMTIERWLRDGKISRPKTIEFGGRKFRLWTRADVAKIKRYKAHHFYEGRGRKKKVK